MMYSWMSDGDVRLEQHQQHPGGEREDDHAVRVDEAVAAGAERLGRVVVLGENRAEQRETVESGIGREQEHEGSRGLHDEEQHRVVAEGR